MTADEKRAKIAKLKKKIEDTQAEYDRAKAMQLALKLVINGTYGAFAHPKFVLSNSHIANAITAMGRDVIQHMLKQIEKYFYTQWHLDIDSHKKLGIEYIAEKENKYYLLNKDGVNIHYQHNTLEDLLNKLNISKSDLKEDKKQIGEYNTLYRRDIHDFSNIKQISKDEPIIIYGDTDSVDKQTLINTNVGNFTIEYLYNKNVDSGSAGITLNGHESVNCKETVLNYDKNKGLYYATVKRIIRHKVTKPKWKLKTKSGEEIIVTNDHSMIVFRDGNKLEVKPSEILKTDKIGVIKKFPYDEDFLINTVSYLDSVEIIYEAKYDLELNDIPKKLYHLSIQEYENNILKKGLIPKSKSKLSKHLDRIYLTSNILDCYNLISKMTLFYKIKITPKNKINFKWIIFEIDKDNLDIKFYKDPNSNGYYIIDNIPAKNIKVVDKEK